MQDEFDVVVVGAGAAGLAAAARLSRAALSVVVLEGQGRIGGRAHTLAARMDLPLDLGCGWLRSADRNPLAALFARAGVALDRTLPAWGRGAAHLNLTPEDQAAFTAVLRDFEAALDEAARTGQEGRALAFLPPGAGRWAALMEANSACYHGAGLSQISVQDHGARQDTGVAWRAPDGYGAAICGLAPRSLIVPHCAVLSIDHEGPRLRLETARGRITAKAAVLTLSSALIAQEAIRIHPRLPAKVDAAIGLPLGQAEKVFLRPAAPEVFPRESHLWGAQDRTATGSYYMRPLGRPVIECHFGGDHARALAEAGPGAATAFAIDEVAAQYGADVRSQLQSVAETRWGADPWAMGAYSHALPGCMAARRALAEPVDGRLFFAGEATSTRSYATAHGAWESGLRAADEALAALGLRAP